jgi:hypothetical protein
MRKFLRMTVRISFKLAGSSSATSLFLHIHLEILTSPFLYYGLSAQSRLTSGFPISVLSHQPLSHHRTDVLVNHVSFLIPERCWNLFYLTLQRNPNAQVRAFGGVAGCIRDLTGRCCDLFARSESSFRSREQPLLSKRRLY